MNKVNAKTTKKVDPSTQTLHAAVENSLSIIFTENPSPIYCLEAIKIKANFFLQKNSIFASETVFGRQFHTDKRRGTISKPNEITTHSKPLKKELTSRVCDRTRVSDIKTNTKRLKNVQRISSNNCRHPLGVHALETELFRGQTFMFWHVRLFPDNTE